MFKNYLKIAVRSLFKHKVFSLINVLGLAVGIAASVLIYLFVRDELGYDRYHANAGRIYRLTADWSNKGDSRIHQLGTPSILARTIRDPRRRPWPSSAARSETWSSSTAPRASRNPTFTPPSRTSSASLPSR
jgi:hypothetical protein